MSVASTRRATRCLALASILSALSVALLYLGSLTGVLDLTVVALTSLIVSFSVIEMKGRYPQMIYLVTAFLSLLLLPDKFSALCYLCLCGYYPILQPHLARFRRSVAFLLKLVGFNLMFAAMLMLAIFVFHMPKEEVGLTWALVLLGNLAFFLYDLMLVRLNLLYLLRFRARLRIDRYLGK